MKTSQLILYNYCILYLHLPIPCHFLVINTVINSASPATNKYSIFALTAQFVLNNSQQFLFEILTGKCAICV